jgi:hypothetical protein
MHDDDYYDNRRQISAIAGALDLEYDVILSTIIIDESEYAEMRRSNLLINRNIHRDGIELWTLRQSAPILASA